MDFKSPFFFLALLCLAIPILIHLFNMRKYKKMYFPSLRLLDAMMVKNKKMSTVQKWILLASRLLAVLFLVMAFTQPFYNSPSFSQKEGIKVLYFDNSMSTTYQRGQTNLLDEMKAQTIKWIKNEQISELIIITNSDLNNLTTHNASQAVDFIEKIQHSAFTQTFQDVYNTLEHIKDMHESDVVAILVSDHQRHQYEKNQNQKWGREGIHFYNLISPPAESLSNIYIDTCYVIPSVNGLEDEISLITDVKKIGQESENIDLQYSINGQNLASKNISLAENDTLISDTQYVSIQSQIDNNIRVYFQSKQLSFDDQYYLSLRKTEQLKVAIINTGDINTLLTQAFNASKKIFPVQLSGLHQLKQNDHYSLIMLNNIKNLNNDDISIIKTLLDNGESIALSLGKNAEIQSINQALEAIAGISIRNIDTQTQYIAQIETQHPLLKDVILRQPDNLQLPTVSYRYIYSSPLNSRPQDVMKMRDGSGLITQFNISKGTLYIIGTPIDNNSTSLTQSYYFAPLMYKMATNNGQTDIQSYEINKGNVITIHGDLEENSILSLAQNDFISIPVQKKVSQGIMMSLPDQITHDSVYTVKNQNNSIIRTISLNHDRIESITTYLSLDELKSMINLESIDNNSNTVLTDSNSMYKKIWKWLLILTILSIVFESLILIKKNKS